MPTPIAVNNLPQFHRRLLFDHGEYLKWLADEPVGTAFYFICTKQVASRPPYKYECEMGGKELYELQWHDKRDIYDKTVIQDHAAKIVHLLDCVRASEFLVQHSHVRGYFRCVWLPPRSRVYRNTDIRAKLEFFSKQLPNVDRKSFDGGLHFTEGLSEFLPAFIDYTFLLRKRDVDCLSLEHNLVVRLTHHLTVDLVTSDRTMYGTLIELCGKIGLNVLGGNNTSE